MNELEELKTRAAERRAIRIGPDSDVGVVISRKVEPAEADLDRAIAIADVLAKNQERHNDEVASVMKERDKAIAAAKTLRAAMKRVNEKQLNGELRDALADTAWLEDK